MNVVANVDIGLAFHSQTNQLIYIFGNKFGVHRVACVAMSVVPHVAVPVESHVIVSVTWHVAVPGACFPFLCSRESVARSCSFSS